MKAPRLKRMDFLTGLFLAFSGALFHKVFNRKTEDSFYEVPFDFIRPPGTTDESLFLNRCVRCRACGDVCAAGCIRFFSASEHPLLAGTPYLIPRLRACNLCTNCGRVCPTGALSPVKKDIKEIAKTVKMGLAVVIESNCLSYNGRVCGVCRDACPLKGIAIKLKPVAKPVVIEDGCIGCGRCEEHCPQLPAAIIVKRKETSHA